MFILSVRFKKNKYRSSLITFSICCQWSFNKNLWSFINCQKTTHWNPISKHYELSDIYLPENTKKAPSFLKKVTQGSSKSGNNLHLSSPRRLTRKQIDWNTHPTKKKCSTTLVYFLSIKAACSRRAPHIFSTKTGMTPSLVSFSFRLLLPSFYSHLWQWREMRWFWQRYGGIILWGHLFIYFWAVWLSPICVRESSPNLSIL